MPKTITRHNFLAEYGSWVAERQTRYARLDKPTSELHALVQAPLTLDNRLQIAAKLARVGPFLLTEGVVRCFRNTDEGWHLMKRGLLYRHWCHRISARARDFWNAPPEKRGPFESAEYLANVAALGLCIARPEAIWTLGKMERGFTDGSVGWCGSDFFAAYLVQLHRKLRGQPDRNDLPPHPEERKQPYSDLIEFWGNKEELGRTIARMCDYHLKWNYEHTDEHAAEFSSPYAMINPVEIHALQAVREEIGLPMPEVQHELLQPPLYPVPTFARAISTEEVVEEDPLLRRIIGQNRRWCDGCEG